MSGEAVPGAMGSAPPGVPQSLNVHPHTTLLQVPCSSSSSSCPGRLRSNTSSSTSSSTATTTGSLSRSSCRSLARWCKPTPSAPAAAAVQQQQRMATTGTTCLKCMAPRSCVCAKTTRWVQTRARSVFGFAEFRRDGCVRLRACPSRGGRLHSWGAMKLLRVNVRRTWWHLGRLVVTAAMKRLAKCNMMNVCSSWQVCVCLVLPVYPPLRASWVVRSGCLNLAAAACWRAGPACRWC